jgi:hypothetical protein
MASGEAGLNGRPKEVAMNELKEERRWGVGELNDGNVGRKNK